MKALLVFLLLVAAGPLLAQGRYQPALKRELDSIYAVDQRYRLMLFDPQHRQRPDSLARLLGVTRESLNEQIQRRLQHSDSTNLQRIRVILQQYGYPGKTLVGEPTNETVWLVIQHSPEIDRYLPLIKKAAEKGELPYFLYAQMLDRQLMRDGKEQLYGTQGFGYSPVNPGTGRREPQPPFIWPIKDPAHVNERRRKVGFDTTVEESARRLGIPYRVVTLEEVAKMPK